MEKYKNLLIIIFIAILGGVAGVLFKIAVAEIPPDLFTFLRFTTAYIAFIPFLKNKGVAGAESRNKLFLISLLGTANVMFFIFGLRYTTATIAGMLYASAPLAVGIFSLIIVREKITLNKWGGIIIGFLGLAAIILAPWWGTGALSNGTLAGNLIIWLAVISFSLYSVLSKKYESVYSPIVLTKYFVLITILVQIIFLSFHPQSLLLIPHISLKSWLIVLYAGILDTTLYYLLYQYVLKRSTPVLTSMTFYIQPIANIILARLLLNEGLTTTFIFGSILIFIGISMVFRDKYLDNKVIHS